MRSPNSLRTHQSYCWQSHFIREHLLPLGHAAWQGYQNQGRGLVSCQVAIATDTSIIWREDLVKYTINFVEALAIPEHLQAYQVDAGSMAKIIQSVQTYDPNTDFTLLLKDESKPEIYLLRKLKISPPDCYRQVQQRWSEFCLAAS
ncbi:hypothetical protein Lepto7376_4367 [[Leptolyngbya] sp. PCC 7376]|uniref:hypothetical protein n=1 Tax=[Leptolyngbya] sp. PCC 7376 TaxID=111781 RepID=UPI00029EC3F8|nr:hypothetical protein [[Leptolyngbya] sp. PCC 7376]AFY40475.1 hypothetical protein Lepto7376_4367 [[Leptolyngbya] sp. PCC 7376]